MNNLKLLTAGAIVVGLSACGTLMPNYYGQDVAVVGPMRMMPMNVYDKSGAVVGQVMTKRGQMYYRTVKTVHYVLKRVGKTNKYNIINSNGKVIGQIRLMPNGSYSLVYMR